MQALVNKTKLRLFEHPENAKDALYASQGTELLFGEIFNIHDEDRSGWVRGQSITDDYHGCVNMSGLKVIDDLSVLEERLEYRVSSPIAPLYIKPNLKSHVKFHIPFEGRLFLDEAVIEENGFILVPDQDLWMHKHHIREVKEDTLEKISKQDLLENIINNAKLFLNCPYIYGGRTAFGLDCSALIQLAFAKENISLPRDSGPQADKMKGLVIENELFIDDIMVAEPEQTQGGDVVFFPGHVGLMIDDQKIIHASSHRMQVVIEPVEFVNKFYERREGHGITAIRRISESE